MFFRAALSLSPESRLYITIPQSNSGNKSPGLPKRPSCTSRSTAPSAPQSPKLPSSKRTARRPNKRGRASSRKNKGCSAAVCRFFRTVALLRFLFFAVVAVRRLLPPFFCAKIAPPLREPAFDLIGILNLQYNTSRGICHRTPLPSATDSPVKFIFPIAFSNHRRSQFELRLSRCLNANQRAI